MANGYAGHIHALCNVAKESAAQAIVGLRKTCEVVEAQCSAMGRRGEENWEKKFKMKLMPEYSVPFALHFLSLCPETPTGVPDFENNANNNNKKSGSGSPPGRKRKGGNTNANGNNNRSPQEGDGYETKEYLKVRYVTYDFCPSALFI
jgi:hypothetical protein